MTTPTSTKAKVPSRYSGQRMRRRLQPSMAVAAPPMPSADPAGFSEAPASAIRFPQNAWAAAPALEVAPWRRNLDLESFGQEMNALKFELIKQQGKDDVSHLNAILTAGTLLYWGGVVACCFCNPLHGNLLGALAISTGVMARWTMVGHHVCHGGYNRQQSAPGKPSVAAGRFHRKTFAVGSLLKRCTDWLDWMTPSAWDVEHNELHHYNLGEERDPDLVERNFEGVREGEFGSSVWAKMASVVGVAFTWKWFYYAPNTLKELYAKEQRQAARRGNEIAQPFANGTKPLTIIYPFERLTQPGSLQERLEPLRLLAGCLLPYAVFAFGLVPAGCSAAAFAIGGSAAAASTFKLVMLNMLFAEAFTNLHSFIIIATNHVGEDIYRFAKPCAPNSGEFYMRAVVGSANFHTGARADGKPASPRGHAVDFMHGWLNYQIEHHAFPDLSMLSYQRAQPRVKALCEKYGIPYVQEPVWTRLRKTVEVMVGKKDMLQWERGD